MGIDNTDDEQVLQLNDLIDYYIEVNSFGYWFIQSPFV
jgi:hypothetical protein